MRRVEEIARTGPLVLFGAWWSLLAFIWSGVRFYESLQHVLGTAWGGLAARPFLQRKLWTIAAFVAAALFFGLTVALTAAVTALGSLDSRIPGLEFGALSLRTAGLLPWLFSVAMVFLLYKFMPNTWVPWRLALSAAVPVGLLWEVSKRLFAAFVVSKGFYSGVYGPMGSFVLLMVWIYWSSVILLFGAEYAAAWQREGEPPGNSPGGAGFRE
jgi:membrane protein